MKILKERQSLGDYLRSPKISGKKIGLVPTMGALHGGHLALIRKAKQENDLVVCSIYVNPTQFNNPDDLKKYPKTMAEDLKLLEKESCDLVFNPPDDVMYPGDPDLVINFGDLENIMEGAYRPGHFHGVALILMKLFNLIDPDRAYFGQKDWQQCVIVTKLVENLFIDLEIVCVPTVRETDGLAMSSRNKLLDEADRILAPSFYQALILGKKSLLEGDSLEEAKRKVKVFIDKKGVQLDYFEVVDSYNLKSVEEVNQHEKVSLCIAGYINSVRLIDNIFLNS